jgi:hypothetical protein
VYHVDCRGWSKVKGIEVVVCVIIRDEGCKVGVVVYVKNGDRVKLWVG